MAAQRGEIVCEVVTAKVSTNPLSSIYLIILIEQWKRHWEYFANNIPCLFQALDPAMVKEVEAVVALFLKKGEKSKVSNPQIKPGFQSMFYEIYFSVIYMIYQFWSFLIQMNYKVDPAIIGGMVVSIGDKFADMSIASKMKKYTDLIQAAA